jgi:hypothetical protein
MVSKRGRRKPQRKDVGAVVVEDSDGPSDAVVDAVADALADAVKASGASPRDFGRRVRSFAASRLTVDTLEDFVESSRAMEFPDQLVCMRALADWCVSCVTTREAASEDAVAAAVAWAVAPGVNTGAAAGPGVSSPAFTRLALLFALARVFMWDATHFPAFHGAAPKVVAAVKYMLTCPAAAVSDMEMLPPGLDYITNLHGTLYAFLMQRGPTCKDPVPTPSYGPPLRSLVELMQGLLNAAGSSGVEVLHMPAMKSAAWLCKFMLRCKSTCGDLGLEFGAVQVEDVAPAAEVLVRGLARAVGVAAAGQLPPRELLEFLMGAVGGLRFALEVAAWDVVTTGSVLSTGLLPVLQDVLGHFGHIQPVVNACMKTVSVATRVGVNTIGLAREVRHQLCALMPAMLRALCVLVDECVAGGVAAGAGAGAGGPVPLYAGLETVVPNAAAVAAALRFFGGALEPIYHASEEGFDKLGDGFGPVAEVDTKAKDGPMPWWRPDWEELLPVVADAAVALAGTGDVAAMALDCLLGYCLPVAQTLEELQLQLDGGAPAGKGRALRVLPGTSEVLATDHAVRIARTVLSVTPCAGSLVLNRVGLWMRLVHDHTSASCASRGLLGQAARFFALCVAKSSKNVALIRAVQAVAAVMPPGDLVAVVLSLTFDKDHTALAADICFACGLTKLELA